MGLTFFTNPMSRGRIVRWMLEETGVAYDTTLVGWTGKPDALLAANPLGKVPTIIHDGAVVTESAAICAYLAETFPEAGLAPTAAERADYYRWMFFTAGPMEAAITDRSLGIAEVPADKQMMAGYGSFARAVDTLEIAVSAHEYIAGDRFTAADVVVGSAIGFFTQWGSIDKRDAFMRYLERMQARPAAVRAREIDDTLIADAQAQAAPQPG